MQQKATGLRTYLDTIGKRANADVRRELQEEYTAATAADRLELHLSKLIQAGLGEDVPCGVESYDTTYSDDERTVTGVLRFMVNCPVDEAEEAVERTLDDIFERTGYHYAGGARDATPQSGQVWSVHFSLALNLDKAAETQAKSVTLKPQGTPFARIPEERLHRYTAKTKSGKTYRCVDVLPSSLLEAAV